VGYWDERTQAEAYTLNDPILVFQAERGVLPADYLPASPAARPGAFLRVDRPNAIIETVKRAEDGDGLIVRLYESHRKRGPVKLRVGFALESAWMTNLLEENETELRIEENQVLLDLKPFQIVTLRLKGSMP
jgi:alpha-mannosidase